MIVAPWAYFLLAMIPGRLMGLAFGAIRKGDIRERSLANIRNCKLVKVWAVFAHEARSQDPALAEV